MILLLYLKCGGNAKIFPVYPGYGHKEEYIDLKCNYKSVTIKQPYLNGIIVTGGILFASNVIQRR